jgi:hypothetical protein
MFVVVAVALAAIAGCSDDKPLNPVTQNEAAISNLIAGNSVFEHDVVSHVVPDTTAGAGADVFWWREYATADAATDFTFHAADVDVSYPYAVVTLTTTYTGNLHIVNRDGAGNYTHTTKALTDVFTQSAQFEQQLSVSDPDRGWVLTKISSIVGGSVPSTLTIDNAAFDASVSPDINVTPTDMTSLYAPGSRYSLQVDEQVSIIIQSGSGVNDGWLHDWYGSGVETAPLINQDLGFYSQQVNTPASLTAADAERIFVIDVLGDGVIDGDAPYEAKIWAVPYLVDVTP